MGKRLVIYRLGSLGDTIVALPCFHKIAKFFPDHERIVLTNFPVSSKAAPLEAILGGSGLIHGSLAYPLGTRSPREIWRLRKELRELGADTLVYLTAPRGLRAAIRDSFFFKLCGFKKIIGVPITKALQQNEIDPDSGWVEPECRRLARCLGELGALDLDDPANWDLQLTEAERIAADQHLAPLAGQPFLAINMGGKVVEKDWGEEHWHELLEDLSSDHAHLTLVIVGGIEDAPRAEAIAARRPAAILNMCGRLSPRESAALLTRASAFVGHDSGPLHLASAVGCSTTGLFGAINKPRKWYPYLGDNIALHDCADVRSISVPAVAAAVRSMLAKAGIERAGL